MSRPSRAIGRGDRRTGTASVPCAAAAPFHMPAGTARRASRRQKTPRRSWQGAGSRCARRTAMRESARAADPRHPSTMQRPRPRPAAVHPPAGRHCARQPRPAGMPAGRHRGCGGSRPAGRWRPLPQPGAPRPPPAVPCHAGRPAARIAAGADRGSRLAGPGKQPGAQRPAPRRGHPGRAPRAHTRATKRPSHRRAAAPGGATAMPARRSAARRGTGGGTGGGASAAPPMQNPKCGRRRARP